MMSCQYFMGCPVSGCSMAMFAYLFVVSGCVSTMCIATSKSVLSVFHVFDRVLKAGGSFVGSLADAGMTASMAETTLVVVTGFSLGCKMSMAVVTEPCKSSCSGRVLFRMCNNNCGSGSGRVHVLRYNGSSSGSSNDCLCICSIHRGDDCTNSSSEDSFSGSQTIKSSRIDVHDG